MTGRKVEVDPERVEVDPERVELAVLCVLRKEQVV